VRGKRGQPRIHRVAAATPRCVRVRSKLHGHAASSVRPRQTRRPRSALCAAASESAAVLSTRRHRPVHRTPVLSKGGVPTAKRPPSEPMPNREGPIAKKCHVFMMLLRRGFFRLPARLGAQIDSTS